MYQTNISNNEERENEMNYSENESKTNITTSILNGAQLSRKEGLMDSSLTLFAEKKASFDSNNVALKLKEYD